LVSTDESDDVSPLPIMTVADVVTIDFVAVVVVDENAVVR